MYTCSLFLDLLAKAYVQTACTLSRYEVALFYKVLLVVEKKLTIAQLSPIPGAVVSLCS